MGRGQNQLQATSERLLFGRRAHQRKQDIDAAFIWRPTPTGYYFAPEPNRQAPLLLTRQLEKAFSDLEIAMPGERNGEIAKRIAALRKEGHKYLLVTVVDAAARPATIAGQKCSVVKQDRIVSFEAPELNHGEVRVDVYASDFVLEPVRQQVEVS
jgi:hypothetical protein